MQPNHPRKQQSWLDKQIEALIGDGDVSHLPNAGQKFDWSQDNAHLPEDLRLAYKMMQDSNIVPEWIAMGAELEEQKAHISRIAQRFLSDDEARRTAAGKNGFLAMRDADVRWDAAQTRLYELIAEYNSKLLSYNITRPTSVAQRVPLTLEEVLRR